MEEAKEHGQETKQKSSMVYPEEGSKRKGLEKERKGKKSWKSSLISWWKFDKNGKVKEAFDGYKSKVSEKRQGHVSGPIMQNSYRGYEGKHKRPFSGPLASLFKSTKREENEMPYMTLDQQNGTHHVQNYGPVYKVT